MRTPFKEWLNEIRSASPTIRRRYLVIFSVGTMLLVTGVWIQYMRSFVIGSEEKSQSAGKVFTGILSAGFGALKEGGEHLAGQIREKIEKKRDITIENPDKNFTVEDLKPIPETPLPKP